MNDPYDNQFLVDTLTSNIFTGMKRCARCTEKKPVSEFNNRHNSKDGKQSYCITCQASYHLKYKYDLSQEAFGEMYRKQAGLCHLCNKTCEQHLTLNVDYCPILGMRKLL